MYHSDKLIYMQPVTHNIASNMQKSVNELGPLFYYSGGGGIWKDVDIADANLRGANVRLMSNTLQVKELESKF